MHGTYRRVSCEDGEYGDGDKMEVTETNDYYALMKMYLLNVFSSVSRMHRKHLCVRSGKNPSDILPNAFFVQSHLRNFS